MNMDKRGLQFVLACVIFYLTYNQYIAYKYPHLSQDQEVTESNAPAAANSNTPRVPAKLSSAAPGGQDPSTPGSQSATETASSTELSDVAWLSEADLTIDTELVRYRFDQKQGALVSIELKRFLAAAGDQSSVVELLEGPLYVFVDTARVSPSSSRVGQTYRARRVGQSIEFWYTQDSIKRSVTFDFPETGYGFRVRAELENLASSPVELFASVGFKHSRVPTSTEEAGSSFLPGTPTGYVNVVTGRQDSVDRWLVSDVCEAGGEPEASGKQAQLDFIGLGRHYFLKVFLPESGRLDYRIMATNPVSDGGCDIATVLEQDFGRVEPGDQVALDFQAYYGPKDLGTLRQHDSRLTEAVDYGFFSVIAKPLLWGLNQAYKGLQNYGLAIILVTIILKLLFYPLTKQAAVSMHKMKKFQPEMQRIRERHKDDPQAQQKEIMQFMVKHKVNPMKGCLPILPQIPVFIAYYQVLMNSIELRHAPFFGWIQDLSAMDPYYITPVLLGIGFFFQQKLTPTTGMSKEQERVMMFMPIIFSVLMLTLPAGMVIYMLTNTLVSIAQQQWLNRKLAA